MTVLPRFDHVDCARRGNNTLDYADSHITKGYSTATLSHLGQPDHLSLLLTPTWNPVVKTEALYQTCLHQVVCETGAKTHKNDPLSLILSHTSMIKVANRSMENAIAVATTPHSHTLIRKGYM